MSETVDLESGVSETGDGALPGQVPEGFGVVPKSASPVAPSEKRVNPLGLDFSCFGTRSTPIPDPARRGIKETQLFATGLKDSVAERPNHSNLCTLEFG